MWPSTVSTPGPTEQAPRPPGAPAARSSYTAADTPTGKATITADGQAIEAAQAIAAAIADKKGTAIALLDVSRLIVLTDVFVIGTGTSNRHVKTLVDEVEAQMRERLGRKPLRREGVEHARWVLLDYGDVVVHLFDAETREYYDLERLWADAPRIAHEPVAAEA